MIGEAGVGKSRLVEELHQGWEEDVPAGVRTPWDVWQGVSYDTTRPYAQYRRVMKEIAGISEADAPTEVRAKISTLMAAAPEAWRERSQRVARALFGVPDPGEEPLEGEAFKREASELVFGSTLARGNRPSMAVFEDLHWCDPASMDLIREAIRTVEHIPILILATMRPDREAPSWGLKQWLETEYPHRTTRLELVPLSPSESRKLIDELLPIQEMPESLRRRILDKTEGNPLFVEEVVRALIDAGVVVEVGDDRRLSAAALDVAIPDTLQALITARLDRLDEETRRTLQLASVIGRTFPDRVLQAVAGVAADVGAHLRTLERLDLIHESARMPEREHAFRHALTQEATYSTILLRRRREFHRMVGEVMEQLYAERLEEYMPLLARHFSEAGVDERTLTYATRAAEGAAHLYANEEAAALFTTAIGAAGRLGVSDERLGRLYAGCGRAMELGGRFDDAVTNYEEMAELARSHGEWPMELTALTSLATLYATPTPKFDPDRGRSLSREALNLADQLGDRAAGSKALWNILIVNVYGDGDLREAMEAGERSLEIARELGLREQMAFTLNDLWRAHLAGGDMSRARASLEEARELWLELDNKPMLTENLASLAALHRYAGEYERTIELSAEALGIAEEIGNRWGQAYSLMVVYDVYLERGEIGRAIETIERCVALADEAGFVAPQATGRADLAAVYGMLGDPERGLALARKALQVAEDRTPVARPWVVTAIARLYLDAGDVPKARATFDEVGLTVLPEPLRSAASVLVRLAQADAALAVRDHDAAEAAADDVVNTLRRIGIRPFVPDALLAKGRALGETGRVTEARAALDEARREADSLGSVRTQWEILAMLSKVAAAEGNDGEASELRTQACELVRRLSDSIADENLTATFLARPDVRSLLAEASGR